MTPSGDHVIDMTPVTAQTQSTVRASSRLRLTNGENVHRSVRNIITTDTCHLRHWVDTESTRAVAIVSRSKFSLCAWRPHSFPHAHQWLHVWNLICFFCCAVRIESLWHSAHVRTSRRGNSNQITLRCVLSLRFWSILLQPSLYIHDRNSETNWSFHDGVAMEVYRGRTQPSALYRIFIRIILIYLLPT